MVESFRIGNRLVGVDVSPLVIAEVGINHNGSLDVAKRMVDSAFSVGCECVKFQHHLPYEEMSVEARSVVPGNSDRDIFSIIDDSTMSLSDLSDIKDYVESKGMIFLCTPFCIKAVDELESIGVVAYKIGSGECNNIPLIRHVASKGKPIIMSTGMNCLEVIEESVNIIKEYNVPLVLLHCVSIYPTPLELVNLNRVNELKSINELVGFSDHSKSIYASVFSISLGACVIEKHFTYDNKIKGPDINLSITPPELKELIMFTKSYEKVLMNNSMSIRNLEAVTSNFAFHSICLNKDIKKGEKLVFEDLSFKRPGTGDYKAKDYKKVIGMITKKDITKGEQLKKEEIKRELNYGEEDYN